MKSKKYFLFFLFLFSLIFLSNSVFALSSSDQQAQVIGEIGLVIIILGVTIIGIIIRNIPMTIIGCLCCMALGIYLAANGFIYMKDFATEVLSILLIAFGGFWTVKAGIESIGD